MTTVEQVYTAFAASLQRMVTANKAKVVSRTWYAAADSNVKSEPAILISQTGRRHVPEKGQPPVRTLLPILTIYIPKQDKTRVVIAPTVNQFLDDLEAISFPPDPVTAMPLIADAGVRLSISARVRRIASMGCPFVRT